MRKLLLFTFFSLTVSFVRKQQYKVYEFKTRNVIGMSVPEYIYANNQRIGFVKSIKAGSDYCTGRMEIKSDFVILCNMRFVNTPELLNFEIVQIDIDSSNHCNNIISSKDTLQIW